MSVVAMHVRIKNDQYKNNIFHTSLSRDTWFCTSMGVACNPRYILNKIMNLWWFGLVYFILRVKLIT